MPQASGKILVIRGGAIGDFILTIPVLTALREQFPEIRIELLGYSQVAQLAFAAGLVDRVRPIDARPMASFFAKGGPLPQDWADYFASFAIVLSYLFDPDGIFQENVARCSKAQFLTGPHRPNETGDLHATDAFLRPLERLAIFNPDPVARIKLPLSVAPPVPALEVSHSTDPLPADSQLLSGWLALHPGSGSERKNWPEENWAALLRELCAQTALRFLLVGGEAEGDRLKRLAAAIPGPRRRIAQSLPLPELALLLQQCSVYLGHDSGISHLAAALGLPGLLLWGHTRTEIWRPRHEQIHLLSDPRGLAHLPVAKVLRALHQHLFPGSRS